MADKSRLSVRARLALTAHRRAGGTEKELARAIGVPPSALAQWKHLLPPIVVDPGDPRLGRLGALLGLSRDDLIESTSRRIRIRSRLTAPLPAPRSRIRSAKNRA